jgi:hypothetical protein
MGLRGLEQWQFWDLELPDLSAVVRTESNRDNVSARFHLVYGLRGDMLLLLRGLGVCACSFLVIEIFHNPASVAKVYRDWVTLQLNLIP